MRPRGRCFATQPRDLAKTEINNEPPLIRYHLNAFVVALRDRGVRPPSGSAMPQGQVQ
jgi:hypothetical protein